MFGKHHVTKSLAGSSTRQVTADTLERRVAKNISACNSWMPSLHSLGLGLTASPMLALSGTITGSRKPLSFAHSAVRSSPLMRCVSCAVKVLVANNRLNFCQSFPAARNIFCFIWDNEEPTGGRRGKIVRSNKNVRGKKETDVG